MKVLLDENLDHALRLLLGQHEVVTAAYMGWAGLKNGELLRAAVAYHQEQPSGLQQLTQPGPVPFAWWSAASLTGGTQRSKRAHEWPSYFTTAETDAAY